jgi:hypothetical protein
MHVKWAIKLHNSYFIIYTTLHSSLADSDHGVCFVLSTEMACVLFPKVCMSLVSFKANYFLTTMGMTIHLRHMNIKFLILSHQ